jgi:hypothetical protein
MPALLSVRTSGAHDVIDKYDVFHWLTCDSHEAMRVHINATPSSTLALTCACIHANYMLIVHCAGCTAVC